MGVFTIAVLLMFLAQHLRVILQITVAVFILVNGHHSELFPIRLSQAIPHLDTVVVFLTTALLPSPTLPPQAIHQSIPYMVQEFTVMRRQSTLPTLLSPIIPTV